MADIDVKILNILINSKKDLGDFVSTVSESLFEKKYRNFVRGISNYYKVFHSCPTLSTLIEFYDDKSDEDKAYFIEIWDEVDSDRVDTREYSFTLSKLKKRYNVELVNLIKEQTENVSEENVDYVNNNLMKLTAEIKSADTKKAYKEVILKDYAEEWKENFIAKSKNPELAQGIFSGFSQLDYYTNGIQPGEVFTLGAASGYGKSIFLINLACNMFMGKNKLPDTMEELKAFVEKGKWQKAYNVLFISLEMPAEELAGRIISNMASVDSLNISKYLVTEKDIYNIEKALYYWKHSPYNIKIVDIPRGCTINDIYKTYEEAMQEMQVDVVIIDYLGIMSSSEEDAENDWLKLQKISEEVHSFARTISKGVWSAFQLTTASEQGKGGIGPHRINRAKGILQNFNLCLMVEDRENENFRTDALIHCIKFRRGPQFIISTMRKEFIYTRFVDMGFEPAKNETQNLKKEDLSGLIHKIFNKKA